MILRYLVHRLANNGDPPNFGLFSICCLPLDQTKTGAECTLYRWSGSDRLAGGALTSPVSARRCTSIQARKESAQADSISVVPMVSRAVCQSAPSKSLSFNCGDNCIQFSLTRCPGD